MVKENEATNRGSILPREDFLRSDDVKVKIKATAYSLPLLRYPPKNNTEVLARWGVASSQVRTWGVRRNVSNLIKVVGVLTCLITPGTNWLIPFLLRIREVWI